MNTSGWTHSYSTVLPAPPQRVFTALTNAGELRRWFAEHVEVDPREGGAFRFWGRHTYGAPSAAKEAQRLTRFEPDHALAFKWPFDGADTEVTVILEAEQTSHGELNTRLKLDHKFATTPAGPQAKELVDDLWRLTLGNLNAHLRGGEGIVLPDFNDPRPEVRASIVIDAPPEQVFAALIKPAALNQWIASAADVDARVGGRYTYGWTYKVDDRDVVGGPTKILDLVPNERLVTDWPDWRGHPTKPKTRVAWHLERAGSGTRVTIIHGEFPRVVDISDYPFGWTGFLQQLKRVVETSASG